MDEISIFSFIQMSRLSEIIDLYVTFTREKKQTPNKTNNEKKNSKQEPVAENFTFYSDEFASTEHWLM